jgi:hypothetical protein
MRAFLLLAAFSSLGIPAHATGVTGADVLKTRLSVRAAALGEALTADVGDLGALSYNPAGLARLSGPQLGFTHFGQVAGVGVQDISYAHPLGFGTLGGKLIFRGQPDIANALALDPPVSAWDLVLGLAWAGRPSRWVDGLPEFVREAETGVQLKYLRSHLGRNDADAFAADLGVQMPLAEGLRGGLALLNLGPPISFIEQADPLPATLQGGVQRSFEPLWGNQINVHADMEMPLQGRMRLHFGLEDWLGEGFALRGGYLLDNGESLNGMTAGFGVRINQEGLIFTFDYAFRPLYYDGFNSLETQHLFGVQLGF